MRWDSNGFFNRNIIYKSRNSKKSYNEEFQISSSQILSTEQRIKPCNANLTAPNPISIAILYTLFIYYSAVKGRSLYYN